MRRVEAWLDQGMGSCALRNPANAAIIKEALQHFDGQRYELASYVIMPNHVHVVLAPLADYSLSTILHAWKSFTSHTIGKLLPDRRGPFWQKESFDHIVRGPDHLERFRIYIADNPSGLSADCYTLCCNTARTKAKS
jgi:type I restriction enzyme R subunit